MNLQNMSAEALANAIADAYPNTAVDFALSVVKQLTRQMEDDFASSLLAATTNQVPRRRRKEDTIITAVCIYYGVTRDEITGSSKARHVVRPRWMACWLLHYRLGMSMIEVGKRLSKDHSSVVNACSAFNPTTGEHSCAKHENDCFDPRRDWVEINQRLDVELGEASALEAAE